MPSKQPEFSAALHKFDGDLWYYYIDVPEEVAQLYIEGNDRRVICTLEGKVSYHCAIMAGGSKGYFINVNNARRKKLGLVLGQQVKASLEKDTSEFGMPMSDELREVLNQEEEANAFFQALTPGKQRTLIHWSDNVKSPDIKIRRALVMTNHLREVQGQIDFKQMNEDMKAANRLARRDL